MPVYFEKDSYAAHVLSICLVLAKHSK